MKEETKQMTLEELKEFFSKQIQDGKTITQKELIDSAEKNKRKRSIIRTYESDE